MALPVALGAWELGALAAGGLATLFAASPQGQEAARATAEALEQLRPASKSDAEQQSKPIPQGTTERCPDRGDGEKEMCPVCGQLPNPTPGFTPAYVPGKRPPRAGETLPPLTSYKRTSKSVKGAIVYERPDKTLVHIDTFHTDKGAEIEVYDRRGWHLGTICPHCGHPRKGPKPGRKLIL